MPRRRRDPRWVQKLIVAGARFLAWLADLAAILVMGYIIKCWPGNGGAVSAGIVGVRYPTLSFLLFLSHLPDLSQPAFPSLSLDCLGALGLVSKNLTSSVATRRCPCGVRGMTAGNVTDPLMTVHITDHSQSVIALLNDSWEMIANADPTRNFAPLTAPRAVLHDLFSMGVCMGGLILLLFADIREKRDYEDTQGNQGTIHHDWQDKRTLFGVAQWFLAAIA